MRAILQLQETRDDHRDGDLEVLLLKYPDDSNVESVILKNHPRLALERFSTDKLTILFLKDETVLDLFLKNCSKEDLFDLLNRLTHAELVYKLYVKSKRVYQLDPAIIEAAYEKNSAILGFITAPCILQDGRAIGRLGVIALLIKLQELRNEDETLSLQNVTSIFNEMIVCLEHIMASTSIIHIVSSLLEKKCIQLEDCSKEMQKILRFMAIQTVVAGIASEKKSILKCSQNKEIVVLREIESLTKIEMLIKSATSLAGLAQCIESELEKAKQDNLILMCGVLEACLREIEVQAQKELSIETAFQAAENAQRIMAQAIMFNEEMVEREGVERDVLQLMCDIAQRRQLENTEIAARLEVNSEAVKFVHEIERLQVEQQEAIIAKEALASKESSVRVAIDALEIQFRKHIEAYKILHQQLSVDVRNAEAQKSSELQMAIFPVDEKYTLAAFRAKNIADFSRVSPVATVIIKNISGKILSGTYNEIYTDLELKYKALRKEVVFFKGAEFSVNIEKYYQDTTKEKNFSTLNDAQKLQLAIRYADSHSGRTRDALESLWKQPALRLQPH